MNLPKQNSPKRKSNFFYWAILAIAFSTFVFLNRDSFFQKYNPQVVSNYLRSQDILDSNNEIKDRIFISDSDIYIASGYLYSKGEDPSSFNFQHPPFVKYLFGLSALKFNLPLLPNLFFAAILLFEVFLLGKLVFKNDIVGLLSSILLLIDPVFKEVSTYALLDLGQMTFLLGFLITTLYFPKHFIGQGVLLGLAIASKFYSPVVIFLGLIYLYKLVSKTLNIKRELLALLIAGITFSLTYMVSFVNEGGLFNIVFHQAKIVKFMLEHNKALEWGGVIKMFFGGYILWPISFIFVLYQIVKTKFRGSNMLIYLIPAVYLLVMCFQIPFTRYFILILPFCYLSLSSVLFSKQ